MTAHGSNEKVHREKNRGSAMIIALVVGIVLMVFCLSLLTVTYSVMTDASKEQYSLQCKEYAKSLSEELEREITVAYTEYAGQETAQIATDNGAAQTKDGITYEPDALWFYLRYNVGSAVWPYYSEDETAIGHQSEDASKYYELETSGTDEVDSAVRARVTMYWEDSGAASLDGSMLYVVVKAYIGDADAAVADTAYTVTSVYELQAGTYDGQAVEAVEERGKDTYNTAGNVIYKSDQWVWKLTERK